MTMRTPCMLPIAVAAAAALAAPAVADTVTLQPVADGTLIESATVQQYALGAALNIYCGRVGTNGGGTLRRSVLRYDLSALPPGAVVTSVSLKVYMSQTNSGAQTINMHRLQEKWGEGASFAFGGGGTVPETNDATWIHTFYPGQLWSVPGGKFAATPSASKSIAAAGAYTFTSTPALVADVAAWQANPALNCGWILVGNEAVLDTAKRFESRESADPTRRPLLTITYTQGPIPGDFDGDGKVNGLDLGVLLSHWGEGGAWDMDADGTVNGADLALLIAAWRN